MRKNCRHWISLCKRKTPPHSSAWKKILPNCMKNQYRNLFVSILTARALPLPSPNVRQNHSLQKCLRRNQFIRLFRPAEMIRRKWNRSSDRTLPPVSPCERLLDRVARRIPPAGLDHPVGAVFGRFGSGLKLTILVQDKAPGSQSALRCGKHRPAERVGERWERGRKPAFYS